MAKNGGATLLTGSAHGATGRGLAVTSFSKTARFARSSKEFSTIKVVCLLAAQISVPVRVQANTDFVGLYRPDFHTNPISHRRSVTILGAGLSGPPLSLKPIL